MGERAPYYVEVTDQGNFVVGRARTPTHSTGILFTQNGFNSAVSQIALSNIILRFQGCDLYEHQ